jgi:hypothetical protein
MEINKMIGNPGTPLSCATAVGAVAGQGSGVRWAEEIALVAGIPARFRHLADRSRVFGVEVLPTVTDLPTNKQPKIYVPHSPLERSP